LVSSPITQKIAELVVGERKTTAARPGWRRLPLLLYGIVFALVGVAMQLVGAVVFVVTDLVTPGLLAPV
jgi:hypothetical protein